MTFYNRRAFETHFTRVYDDNYSSKLFVFKIKTLMSFILITLISIFIFCSDSNHPALAQGIVLPNNDFVLDNRDLVVEDSNGRVRVRVDAQSGNIFLLDESGDNIVRIESQGANIFAGGGGQRDSDGDIVLTPANIVPQSANNASVRLDGATGAGVFGGNGTNGTLIVRDQDNNQTVAMEGENASIILGQEGKDGNLLVRDGSGTVIIDLQAQTGNIRLGQNGKDGDIFVRNENGETTATVDGETGQILLGRDGQAGTLIIEGSNGEINISLVGATGSILLGGNGQDGKLLIFDENTNEVISLEAENGEIRARDIQASVIRGGGINADNGIQLLSDGAGITFSDGTVQATAQLEGPQGRQGDPGPPGPPTTTSAVCQDGTENSSAPSCGFICSNAIASAASPCTITSDTGFCSASSFTPSVGFTNRGSCCVCAP